MKKTNGIIDNLSFKQNQEVDQADKTICKVLRKEKFACLDGFTSGFDEDTGEVLCFFMLDNLRKLSQETQNDFLADIKKNWVEAGFTIIKEEELDSDVYYHVAFPSLFFRLRKSK